MKINRRKARKLNEKRIGRERIRILFHKAEEAFPSDRALADRYVEMARKIAMKLNIRMPSELRRKFCKHCYSFLMPGVNCRVRTKEKKIVYYCKNCKKYMRIPIGNPIGNAGRGKCRHSAALGRR